jgi:hypothetical protein
VEVQAGLLRVVVGELVNLFVLRRVVELTEASG